MNILCISLPPWNPPVRRTTHPHELAEFPTSHIAIDEVRIQMKISTSIPLPRTHDKQPSTSSQNSTNTTLQKLGTTGQQELQASTPEQHSHAIAQAMTQNAPASKLPSRPLLIEAEHKKRRDDNPSGTSHSRHTRSIDSRSKEQWLGVDIKPAGPLSPNAYKEFSVNPDPGKSVAEHDKEQTPVNIGININIKKYTETLSKDFKSANQEAATFLKKTFKEKWNLNIDPDKTYLTTYDYNTEGKEPYPANVIQRISLTQALLKNAQDTPEGRGYSLPHFEGGPNVTPVDNLTTFSPGIFDFKSRFAPNDQKAHTTHTYQGIYTNNTDSTQQIYNASTQLSVSPKEFKKLIWDADFQAPYKKFLDKFWSSHEEKYPILTKASLVKAAHAQHQEGSLTTYERQLVMRAAGVPNSQASWPDLKLEVLLKPAPKDPDTSIELLNIGQYSSTDIMVITDKKGTTDDKGNKIHPVLLHIPGNSSPIHRFNSQSEMTQWLAKEMANPAKQAALSTHFALKDDANGWTRAGLTETLAGLGAWPNKRETPGGLVSYEHRAFTGYWPPNEYITTAPVDNPFRAITQRQKERSYSDSAQEITSDRDVTKNRIFDGFEKVSKIALFMTPLALVMPEVVLALDAFYIANNLVDIGVGIDDKVYDKPKGDDRIIFGALNAVPILAPRILSAANKATGAIERTPALKTNITGEAAEENTAESVTQKTPRKIDAGFTRTEAEKTQIKNINSIKNLSTGEELFSTNGNIQILSGDMEDLTQIDEKLYTFVDDTKTGKKTRLNILVHGSIDSTTGIAKAAYNGTLNTPQELLASLTSKGVDPRSFDKIRLLSCNSAAGGNNSFAAEFQKLVERPVKGYDGILGANIIPEDIKNATNKVEEGILKNLNLNSSSLNPAVKTALKKKAEDLVNNMLSNRFKTIKKNPHWNPVSWWNFQYNPVRFPSKP